MREPGEMDDVDPDPDGRLPETDSPSLLPATVNDPSPPKPNEKDPFDRSLETAAPGVCWCRWVSHARI
jgi:hypothetical protein